MAIDHVRDLFSNVHFDPTDLARTTPALFVTRVITHCCAPVFCFLAGTGAYLSSKGGKSRRDLSSFLVTRGLWPVVLELTLAFVLLRASISSATSSPTPTAGDREG